MNMKKCKRYKSNKVEDDAHILAVCPYNKDLKTKRHNYAVKKLAKELMNNHQNARIWREQSWQMGTELQRLDT